MLSQLRAPAESQVPNSSKRAATSAVVTTGCGYSAPTRSIAISAGRSHSQSFRYWRSRRKDASGSRAIQLPSRGGPPMISSNVPSGAPCNSRALSDETVRQRPTLPSPKCPVFT